MSEHKKTAQEFAPLCGNVTTLDLRTPAEVASEYIDGCLCLPIQHLTVEQFEKVIAAEEKQRSGTDPIYLLCQSGKRAEMAVQKLAGKIERPLIIIEGGLNALKSEGLKIQFRTSSSYYCWCFGGNGCGIGLYGVALLLWVIGICWCGLNVCWHY